MSLLNILYSTTTNKCPRCNKGKVFNQNNPYSLGAFKMNEDCDKCQLHYEMEPGFFYGAMYVSYGFMSGIFIVWFFMNYLFFELGPWQLFSLVTLTMLLLFPVVFRWARTLWMNFFIKYDKSIDSTNKIITSS